MKNFICVFVFLLTCGTLSLMSQTTVEKDGLTITFNGDRATVTQEDVTANYAIGLLVDNARKADFVTLKDGGLFYPVWIGNADGVMAIWWLSYEDGAYYAGFCDGPANDGSSFSNLADAKKCLKAEMRAYYAINKTLNAMR